MNQYQETLQKIYDLVSNLSPEEKMELFKKWVVNY